MSTSSDYLWVLRAYVEPQRDIKWCHRATSLVASWTAMRTEDRAIVLVSIGVSRSRGLVANALRYNADSQIQLCLMIIAHS